MKTQTIESFLEEGMPFTELLPYYGYENGFFVLKDGSLGQVWEAVSYTHLTLPTIYSV